MVDSTKSRFAPYVMARLALSPSRDSDRGAASLFRKNLQFSPLYKRYIYILDTNSLVESDRDFYKDLSTHSSYSKSKPSHGMGGSEK